MSHDETVSALLDRLREGRRFIHGRFLALVHDLTQEQLVWSAGLRTPPIAFHLWHWSRAEDHETALALGTPQIWYAEQLRAAWGWTSELGEDETGIEMGDEMREGLAMPAKDVLVSYSSRTFATAEAYMDSLSASTFDSDARQRLVSYAYMGLVHGNRHLGMIEALRGVIGISGTATR